MTHSPRTLADIATQAQDAAPVRGFVSALAASAFERLLVVSGVAAAFWSGIYWAAH
jgi:hypothetical protein